MNVTHMSDDERTLTLTETAEIDFDYPGPVYALMQYAAQLMEGMGVSYEVEVHPQTAERAQYCLIRMT